jgi:hypothetical protein
MQWHDRQIDEFVIAVEWWQVAACCKDVSAVAGRKGLKVSFINVRPLSCFRPYPFVVIGK